MEDTELQKLIAGCLKQNRGDQKMLYKTFYSFSMSICLRYAANRYEAAENMNQGFKKVFASLHQHPSHTPFSEWVARIMVYTAIDNYRIIIKKGMFHHAYMAPDIAFVDLPDREVFYENLLFIIQQLPIIYRTVFNLFAIDGYSHEEISKMMDISIGTTKSYLYKAREQLNIMYRV
jgi:RNA polymerase sigma factor (sigma-70 family)